MGLLSHLFFFNLFVLLSIAYVQLPVKYFKDGSKSSFVQAPYISTVRDQKVKEIQEEITNSWPEGIITYYLDDKSYDMSIGNRIRIAMSVVEEATCIQFRVAKNKPEGNITWIHITNTNKKRQCEHDPKFVNKGEIMLILGYDCLQQKDIIHSLLHGIGFKDEVTHPHRDKYIRVLWDNIQPVYRYLYRIRPVDTGSIVEYDPLSVMHFHDRAFSSNGKATIVPLESGLIISPSESLSQLDKMRLQLYFGHECKKRKFSYLMETCKNNLKSENEIELVKNSKDVEGEDLNIEKADEDPNTKEKVDSVNTKEDETEKDNSEDNQTKDTKDNENSDENIIAEDRKEKQEKENTEENVANVNLKDNKENTEENVANVKLKDNKENTEENVENKNTEEYIANVKLKDNKENTEENVADKNTKENTEEFIANVKLKENKENTEENASSVNNASREDSTGPVTALKGPVYISNPHLKNEDSGQKTEDLGMDLNIEADG